MPHQERELTPPDRERSGAPPGRRERTLRWALVRCLSDVGAPLLAVICAVLLVQALLPAGVTLAGAWLIGAVWDLPGRASAAWAVLGAYVVLVLAGHLTDGAVQPFRYLAKTRMDGAQRARVAAAAGRLTMAELESPQVQDLVRIAAADPQHDTERTPGDGALAQLGFAFRVVSAGASCGVLLLYAWWPIPLVVAAAFGMRAVFSRRWGALNRLQSVQVGQDRRAAYWRETVTTPATGREARIFGFEDWVVERVLQHVRAERQPLWRMSGWVMRSQLWGFLLMAPPLGVVYAVAAADAASGRVTATVEVAVLSAALTVYNMIYGTDDVLDVQGAGPALDATAGLIRLASSPAATPPPAADGARSCMTPVGTGPPPAVALSGVRFTYPEASRPVLDGVDLRIEPGEMLALVGLNGAGKSTLIKLLTGLYRPSAGRITIDGVDLHAYGVTAWRRQVAVVFQDFIRYQLSAAENVTLGHGDGPTGAQALTAAARQARMDTVVDRLPDGWDTPLTRARTGGVDLSGGQWQQVALARALFAVRTQARLLVLDEPTAHLDVRTEAELFAGIRHRDDGTSVMLISHRLATVRHADRIALLDGGRITETGSHRELMTLDRMYAALFRMQAERFAGDGEDPLADEDEP